MTNAYAAFGNPQSSFLLEYFHCIPRFVGRGLLVFEGTLMIHFREGMFGIKIQAARKQDFQLREITIKKLARIPSSYVYSPNLTVPDRAQRMPRLPRSVKTSTSWVLSFDLGARDGTQIKFVANQIRRQRTQKNVHSINARQPFQTRRQINRIANHPVRSARYREPMFPARTSP